MNNMVLELLYQADWMSKFVLLLLLVLSIVCWALFFSLVISLYTYRRQSEQALRACQNVQSFDDVLALSIALQDSLVGPFLARTVKTLKELQRDRMHTLTPREADLVEEAMYSSVQELVAEQERYLPVFSTAAEVSPLIGLFGTVWGLIHSFMRISQFQSADITTVAPGISEALITTLAGLMVAIPALMMFHYAHHQLRDLEGLLCRFSDRIQFLIKQRFMSEGRL
jgi:biopolymer transport protein TolQ